MVIVCGGVFAGERVGAIIFIIFVLYVRGEVHCSLFLLKTFVFLLTNGKCICIILMYASLSEAMLLIVRLSFYKFASSKNRAFK